MEQPDAGTAVLEQEIAGLENLERPLTPRRRLVAKAWSKTWPGLAAVAMVLAVWQLLWLLHWRPRWLFPSPATVFERLGDEGFGSQTLRAIGRTLTRGVGGFSIALLVGTVVGTLVARSRILRSAVGSMIAGLQTMPSIAWFPFAILIFGLTETAIVFVVVLGAAPSIASGLISGIDHIPPVLLRAGRVMGARGVNWVRHVLLPAAIPGYVAGVKQGWAFAWRSLMAGELLVVLPGKISLGAQLQFSREFNDAPGLMATMIVILVIGIVVDAVVFGKLERAIRRRRGLIDHAAGV